jgi:hypothetical protein
MYFMIRFGNINKIVYLLVQKYFRMYTIKLNLIAYFMYMYKKSTVREFQLIYQRCH